MVLCVTVYVCVYVWIQARVYIKYACGYVCIGTVPCKICI